MQPCHRATSRSRTRRRARASRRARSSKRDAVDRVHDADVAPQERRRASEREVLDEVAHLDEGLAVASGRPPPCAPRRLRARRRSAASQRPGPGGRRRVWPGVGLEERRLDARADGERVRAARMERAAARHAGSGSAAGPGSARRRSQRGRRAAGSTRRRPQVYGCSGASRIVSSGALLDDPARVHDGDLVGRLGDDAEVVRDEHDRCAALRAGARAISSRICAWTVTSSAVVGSSAISTLRVEDERHRDHHALAHAAGELVRVAVDAARAAFGIPTAVAAPRPRGAARPRLRDVARGRRIASSICQPDPVERMQGRQRVLEDHRDPLPADRGGARRPAARASRRRRGGRGPRRSRSGAASGP